ncbi:heterokaryon incompatibility protein-domain-containing protein [Alternaria rosae]|uniref:heterokaryon incompatibility protein-domain-containing protein n=1 Tax=Alternaria rosae TaxID=1187941 RepID=UPI001E8CE030|nr:heterokaryon incompatibility protein-domain-containing protein [Alternaria rosae]KAH6875807.1 heterokaryon incompatibility protein-domain-containing protein [Alternaria rosae]
MTSGTPSSAFEHDPLPDSTTHFRLLHILCGDFGQHVECEISSWLIDDAASYYAISYTWGDPAETTEITVNGKPLVVRRNCEYVLQQAFATKASRYYWVDAICIDQTNIQERSHQVGIMGDIYSEARHVFACVGPHADDSKYLMATIDRQRPILETINEWGQSVVGYNFTQENYFPALNPIYGHMRQQLRCLFTIHTSERLRIGEAFISYIQRPYFTRVWVLQELHLATRMSYCCGADVQPGECFRALDSLVDYWINRHEAHFQGKLKRYQKWILRRCVLTDRPSKKLWRVLQRSYSTIEKSRSCLRLGVSTQKQGLDGMLAVLHNFHCVDTRDNLYGILSLIRWPQGQGPTPDYTKDNFEVAKHVLGLWFWQRISKSFTNLCSRLFKLFHISLELASLRHAIALRSRVIPQADLRIQGNRTSQSANAPTHWSGVQISDEIPMCESIGDRRQPRPNSCYMERERDGCFVRVRISSTATVCAPVNTKVGDWCLVAIGHPNLEDGCKLILRESKDGGYFLVGPALTNNRDHHRDVGLGNDSRLVRSFVGYLDPEDMMVLAWTLDQFADKEEASDKEIEKFLVYATWRRAAVASCQSQ